MKTAQWRRSIDEVKQFTRLVRSEARGIIAGASSVSAVSAWLLSPTNKAAWTHCSVQETYKRGARDIGQPAPVTDWTRLQHTIHRNITSTQA